MLTTGVILLNLDDLNVISVPPSFTIEFSAPQGFARLPRLLRIEPNVIPIQQGRTIEHELHVEAIGQPDWQFTLDESGLCFAAGDESPITVELVESGMADVHEVWRRCDHLSDAGPNDNVYELDVASRRVTFGNGVNGRVPPSGAKVEVSYSVSDAEAGQVARNRKWKVAGFEGVFGINPQPIAGGAASPGEIERRRKARWRAREDRALVTAEDITRAALALPLLEVARAWMTPPDDRMLHTGVQTLFALRIRPAGVEPEQIPETAQWLGAIHHALSPRLPLGTRLAVEAPRYRSFSIQVTLEAHPRLDPAKLKAQVMQELGKRFTLDGRHDGRLVSRAQTATPRPPGVALTKLDLTVWLRGIEGVKRVTALRLLNAAGKEVRAIAVPLDGLPRWLSEDSFVEIEQSDARKVS
jgi:predicted phage baseplate assembly protein